MGNSSVEYKGWPGARRSPVCLWKIRVKTVMDVCTSATTSPPSKDRKKEIGRDLLSKMCRDLNIDPHEL